MKEYMKQVLKAKTSMETFIDKIKPAVAGDAKAGQCLDKIKLYAFTNPKEPPYRNPTNPLT